MSTSGSDLSQLNEYAVYIAGVSNRYICKLLTVYFLNRNLYLFSGATNTPHSVAVRIENKNLLAIA